MAFPAAPTESGTAKIHFLTTDGNAAAGWVAIETGTTGTGSNTVGWAGIATHVEGDEVADPGDITTSAAPVVLVAGDDGTNAVPLQLSGSDLKITLDSELVVLGAAATTAIGKLGANSGVDIGDVDVTTLIPGTGASQLGKAADAVVGASTETGVMVLAIRRDANTTLVDTTGDYAPLQVDVNGKLKVEMFDGGDTLTVASHAVTNAGTFATQATLQAGTAEVGKLAAGVAEIGNVKNAGTFATQATLQAGTAEIGKLAAGVAAIGTVTAVGNIAHDSADSGNPVKIGGVGRSAEPTPVTAGDRVDSWFDRYGRLVVINGHPDPEKPLSKTLSASGETEIIPAPGASVHIYITHVKVTNGSTSVERLDLLEGSGGTVRDSSHLAADGGGFSQEYKPWWKMDANTALIGSLASAASDVRVTVQYFLTADI